MNERMELRRCRIQGMESEHDAISITISNRQRKHKTVAGLQARRKEVTHDILKMEIGKC